MSCWSAVDNPARRAPDPIDDGEGRRVVLAFDGLGSVAAGVFVADRIALLIDLAD